MAVSNLLSNTFFLILKDLAQIERDFLGDMIYPQRSMWVWTKISQSWEWELSWEWMTHSAEDTEGTPFSLERRTKKRQSVNARVGRYGEPYISRDGLRTSHTTKVWYLIFYFKILCLCSIANLWESWLHSQKYCLCLEKTCVQIVERRLLPVCVSAKAE